MALLDVTDLLTDPDFSSTFDILRSTETVDQHGIASRVEQTISLSGVIEAGSGQTIVMLDDGTRISDSLTLWCEFPLWASFENRPADIVLWKGQRYVVKSVEDWTNFGRGYVKATCEFTGINQ